jgi:hypothetical protein
MLTSECRAQIAPAYCASSACSRRNTLRYSALHAQTIARLDVLDGSAGRLNVLDGGHQGVGKIPRLARKLDEDSAIYEGDGRVIATGLEKAVLEIFRLRVQPRSDECEFKYFVTTHPSAAV